MKQDKKNTPTGENAKAKKWTRNRLRDRTSKVVLVSNGILFALIFIYYIANGFLMEEVKVLMGLLAPITGLYVGTVIKHIAANAYIPKSQQNDAPVNQLYVKFTQWAVPLHFFVLLFAISLKALGNFISFEEVKMIFILIESAFGAYVGLLISSLYGTEQEETDDE